MPEMQTVFIIDPELPSRKAVAEIATAMRLPERQYANAEDFLKDQGRHSPGCLVAEFRLPGISGIELQEYLKSQGVSPPMIFLTSYPETASIVRAMQRGAITVLEKPVNEQDLMAAINRALSRDQTIRRIDAKHSELRGRLAELTPKEQSVLELMIQGTSNRTIASRLDVSVRTVETRRHQIFKKTRTDSIAQLVRLVAELGLEDEDES